MPTTLTAGDIAIIGLNADNPDAFNFVTLVDLEAGTEIFFTDNGVFSDGTFRANEGVLRYLAPASGVAAGTVVSFDGIGGDFAAEAGSFALATSGDQVIAYQDNGSGPEFIFAVQTNSTVFQTGSDDANQSDLPTGLVVGETAVAVGFGSGPEDEFDNSTYNGAVTSGTKAELLAAIADPANWNGDNTRIAELATGPFSVTDGGSAIVINEVIASHTGTDNTEFVEFFGPAGASLDGLSLLVIEGEASGDPGSIDERFDFGPGDVIGENGFFLIGNAEGLQANYGVTPNIDVDLNLENGDSTYALVQTLSIGEVISGAEVVLDAVALTGTTGDGTFFFDAPVVGPDGSFFPAGARRVEDGVDTDSVEDWTIGNFFLNEDNTPTAGTEAVVEVPTVINEVIYRHTGPDNTEFVELFGTPGGSLAGLSVIEVDLGGNVVFRLDLADDATFGENGFYLIGNPEGLQASYAVTPDVEIATDALAGDAATFALVETATLTAAEGEAVSGSETVVDAVAFTDPASVGSAFPFNPPVVGPDGTFPPAGGRRLEDGVDTDSASDWTIGSFFLSEDNTPTSSTTGSDTGGETVDATIPEIQGAGLVSDFVGQNVRTVGIVTAVDTNGFYFQDAEGDGDDATSDGIFVFTGSAPTVAVSDEVEVVGNIIEFGGGENLSLTEFSSPSSVTVLSTNNELPDAVQITADGRPAATTSVEDGINFFESLEGMRVQIVDPVSVSPTDGNEIYVLADNGAGSDSLSERGTINNGLADFNPERLLVQLDSGVLSDTDLPEVAVGTQFDDIFGVVNYSGGEYEIELTSPVSVSVGSILAPEMTELTASPDQITIASYNVLNLDPGDGTDRFNALGLQIVENLGTPDIIGLQEIQDNNGATNDGTVSADATLQALIDGISASGGPEYVAIDNTFIFDGLSGGQPGGNIRTAFLYNPERVDLVEGSVEAGALLAQDDPASPFNGGRLPLAATFAFGEEEITVVNNHFSSKGGSVPLFGSTQPTDSEAAQEDPSINGSLNERREQAQAVNDYVDSLLDVDPDQKIVVLGDLNEFEFVSPLDILAGNATSNADGFEIGAGDGQVLTNLTDTLDPNEGYTFIFQGNSQSLDHILVTDNLVGSTEFDIVHTNVEFVEEVSDHEPLVARIDLGSDDPEPEPEVFTLQLLHAGDQEGSIASIESAPNFSAVLNALRDDYANTLTLSSGDAIIPGVFFSASEAAFGTAGIGDIQIQNELGFQAIALGNHEFDQGTGALAGLIDGSAVGDFSSLVGSTLEGLDFTGADFPYLSANLDYSTDANLAPLAVEGGQAPQANVVTSSTVISMPANGASMADGENGYTVTPIFTVGEEIDGYAPPGIMDGIGAYELNDTTVRVLVNHELTDGDGYPYTLANGLEVTGARVSYFDIDKETKTITDSGLAYDTMYAQDGTVIDEISDFVEGRNGISRFCSSVLIEAEQFGEGRGLEDRIYFTGEETGGNFSDVSGGEWALDVATGELWAIPAMGRGAWENVAEVDTGTTTHTAFILMDDTSPFDADGDGENEAAPMYLYVGEKDPNGDFLARNGLSDGKLYVWVSDEGYLDPRDYNGAVNNAPTGGTWVEVDNAPQLDQASVDGSTGYDQYGYPTQKNLWTQSEALGAFGFSRPEDVATNPADGTEVAWASTGRQNDFDGADQVGTIYSTKLDFTDIDAPKGVLSIIYDGDQDPTQALRSPDNLDWADDGFLYIQEDRAAGGLFGPGSVNPHDSSIIRVDPTTGETLRVAEINQDVTRGAVDENVASNGQADIGDWESSGILDVSTLFGEEPGSLHIFDVQAHALDDQERFADSAQPRLIDEDLKEGGQLAFLSKDVDLGDAAELIGVVGATTPTLGSISSPGDVTIRPEDFDGTPTPEQLDALAAEIQAEVDALLAANPGMNKIIVLSHMQQISIEQELATRLTDVDIIMAGGSNTLLADDTDVLRAGDTAEGPYPILTTDANGKPVAVVNTDGNYNYVGRLVVDFDENGEIIAESIDENISGAFATDDAGVAALEAEGLVDPEVQAIVDRIEEVIIEQSSAVFGVSDVFLNGDRGSVRTEETNLGNLTADANLAIAQEVDETVIVSIKNGGGIRANIGIETVLSGDTEISQLPNPENPLTGAPEGAITQIDIQNTLAFNNGLVLLTVTRENLVAQLENGVAATEEGETPGQFAQVAGVQFSYDTSLEPGSRVLNAAIVDENGNDIDVLVRDGEFVGDASGTVRVVTLNFLADGGNGYTFDQTDRVDLTEAGLAEGDASFAEAGSEQDALAEYLLDNFATPETAFAEADTGIEDDMRIQNVAFREDTIIDEPLVDEIVGTDGNDRLVGTDEADVIRSLGGRLDQVTGLAGADTFVFGGEANDGERGRTIIRDFNVDEDIILLEEGAVLSDAREVGNSLVLYLEGDRDLIYVRGENVSIETVEIFTADDPFFVL